MSKLLRFWAVCAVLALGVAACGADDDDGAQADGSATTADDSGDSGGAGGGEADRDHDLVMSYPTPTKTLDPHLVQPDNQISFVAPMYDRLTRLSGDLEVQPMVAESWEFSEDGTALTLSLRDDVTFHDGSSVDAEAVKASLDRALSLEGSTAKNLLSSVTEVTVVDPTTVELSVSSGAASLPNALAMGAGTIINPAVLEDSSVDLANSPPPESGSGPYVLDSYNAGETIRYVRSDDQYWDEDAVNFASIEIRNIAGAPVQNGVRSGELDLGLLTGSAIAEGQTLIDQGEVQGTTLHSISVNGLMFAPDVEKTADVRIRQAIALALDADSIGPPLTGGNCEVTNQLLPVGAPTYNDQLPEREQDVEMARQLLEEAGATDLSLNIIFPTAGDYFGQTSEAVQQQLAEVGIDVSITGVPPADVVTQISGGQVDGAVYPISASPHPDGLVQNILLGVFELVPDAEVEHVRQLAEEGIDPTLSEDEQTAAYHEVWAENYENVWFLPLCDQVMLWVHQDGFSGFDDMAFGRISGFEVRALQKAQG